MCRCNFSKSVGLLAVLTRSHTSWRVLGDGRNPNSNIFNHRSTTGWLNNGWNQDLPRVPNGSHRSNFQKTRLFSCQKTKNASSTTHLPEALHHIATCFFLHRALKKNEQLFSRNDTWWYLYIIRSCVPLFSFQGFHNFAFYDWSLLHRPPRILEAIDISPGMGPKSGRTSMSKKWAALG